MVKKPLTIRDVENHVNSLTNGLISEKNYFTASELLNMDTDEIPCLLAPLLPKTGLSGFGGTSDVGKSSFLRQLSTHIVLDKKEFLGFRLNATHKSVIYVSTEDDEKALSWLLRKQQKCISYNNEDLQGLRFLLDSNNLLQQLDNKLSEQSADLVILDAFSDIYFDKINDAIKVREFLNPYMSLARKHQCLILILHHTGKKTEELEPSKHNLVGSQGLESKLRAVMELRKDQQNADIRHLCVVKGNYIPQQYKGSSYELLFTENMTYETTGERVPFELLKKVNSEAYSKNSDTFIKAKAFYEEGKTMEWIASELGYADKSSISKLFRKYNYNTKSRNQVNVES